MRVLARLQTEYTRADQLKRFEGLKEFLFEKPGAYVDHAAKIKLSENGFGVALSRMKQRYRQLLRMERSDFVLDKEDVSDERLHIYRTLRNEAKVQWGAPLPESFISTPYRSPSQKRP